MVWPSRSAHAQNVFWFDGKYAKYVNLSTKFHFIENNLIDLISQIFSKNFTEPLTNGNHVEQEDGENNATDIFKEHLATKPKSPADPGTWPRNNYLGVTQPFTRFCLLTEPTTIPNESKSRKNSASSSSRAKSGSSRPHTGYGKNRTSTDEQVNDSGKWPRNN